MANESGSKAESERIDYYAALNEIFQKAKEKDEFEYASALLRIRGMEDAGWDPLVESYAAINDYIALIESPLRDITKIRLALLTYSHITEIDAVYDMLANMLLTINGKRCSITPFADYAAATKKRASSPFEKIAALKDMEKASGITSLGGMFDVFFDNKIRNAFYHSDYTIYGNEFRYRRKYAVAAPIAEVMRKIQECINFYLAFMRLQDDHRRSYKEPKIIKGRLAPNDGWLDVELTIQEGGGLIGFRTPPTGGQSVEQKRG